MIRILSMFTIVIFILSFCMTLTHAKRFDSASPKLGQVSNTNATDENSDSRDSAGHADYVKTNKNATSQKD